MHSKGANPVLLFPVGSVLGTIGSAELDRRIQTCRTAVVSPRVLCQQYTLCWSLSSCRLTLRLGVCGRWLKIRAYFLPPPECLSLPPVSSISCCACLRSLLRQGFTVSLAGLELSHRQSAWIKGMHQQLLARSPLSVLKYNEVINQYSGCILSNGYCA